MSDRTMPRSSVRYDRHFRRWFWRCWLCHPSKGMGSAATWREAMDRMCGHLLRGQHDPFGFRPFTPQPEVSIPGGCAGCRRTGICNCTVNPWAPRVWCSA